MFSLSQAPISYENYIVRVEKVFVCGLIHPTPDIITCLKNKEDQLLTIHESAAVLLLFSSFVYFL